MTNSVMHAKMGPADSIGIDVGLAPDRLRIAVTDERAESIPHVVESDIVRPGGMGLLLVKRLSAAWGVVRERSEVTHVWCEVPRDPDE